MTSSIPENNAQQSRRRAIAIPLAVFAAFLVLYGATARSDLQVVDEVAVFATGMNLATRGTLAIDELQWLEDAIGELHIAQRGPDGHLYAKYFPGNVLGSALIYTLVQRPADPRPYEWDFKTFAPSATGAHLALGLNAVLGALALMMLYLLLARRFRVGTALLTVILVGLCTDWWYQSRGFLSEVGAGALLVSSLYFADSAEPYPSGASFGLSLLFRPLNLIALPVWGLSLRRKGRQAIWSGLFILAGLAGLGIYNYLRFGSPFNFGYAEESFRLTVQQSLLGLFGLLFSPGRSVFLHSPILLLAVPGAWLLYRQAKDLTVVCLLAVGAYLFAIAVWHAWDGGWTWGSRLLTPVVPLAGVLVAPVVDRLKTQRWLIAVVVVLAVLGCAVQVIALARNPLIAMNENVGTGLVTYEETLYTFRHSWMALQLRGLAGWNLCDLDGYALRLLLRPGGICGS